MNTHKVSNSLEASVDYLRIAVGAADDELADALSDIIEQLRALDPHPLRGPLTVEKPDRKQPSMKSALFKDVVSKLRTLRRDNPAASNKELGEMLALHGYRTRSGGTYSSQHIWKMLKQGA